MMRVWFVSLGMVGLLAGGCGNLVTVNQLPATVTLRLGGDIQITSPNVRFRLVEIVSDSRCPADVVCIQEGSVNLRFSVSEAGAPESGLFLETGHSESIFGVSLRITEVEPARLSTVPVIHPGDYRITLEITPAPS